jgi:hypothetical protein
VHSEWEILNNLPSNVGVPGCAPFPTNKNLIMVTLQQPTSATTILYDIYQNTVTTATTTPDLYGADLDEICRDGNLHAVPAGPSAKSYTANSGGISSYWVDVTGPAGMNMLSLRYFSTTAVVARSVVNGVTGFPGGCPKGC